ncbi:hypothetical protein CVT25_014143 [Psilocybe cyanescens]|uniref:GRF-type domain-containing protein n=1 Tax=Psilocybe cyanescens TaxID=93625 RepID=A0A409XG35_PSICY|nr:hypothetical protein CVT25_014143 [Psilocybe cyanescens]
MEHNDEPPKCAHNLPARLYTTYKEPHVGREFYRCPKTIGDQQCKFFAWVDGGKESPETHTTALPSTPVSTARPSNQRHSDPLSTPTPVKRNGSDIDNDCKYKRTRTSIFRSPVSSSPPYTSKENADSNWGGWGSGWPPPSTPPKTNNIPSNISTSPWATYISGGAQGNMSVGPSSSQETLKDESVQPTLTPELISDMIRRLQAAPEYIQKLDRKRNAAEKSRDAKNSKMISLQEQVNSLENEVQKLKAREKQLEEVIAAYEADV